MNGREITLLALLDTTFLPSEPVTKNVDNFQYNSGQGNVILYASYEINVDFLKRHWPRFRSFTILVHFTCPFASFVRGDKINMSDLSNLLSNSFQTV